MSPLVTVLARAGVCSEKNFVYLLVESERVIVGKELDGQWITKRYEIKKNVF